MSPDLHADDHHSTSQKATLLFIGTALVAAITVASMQISGWSGGRLRNDIEVLFWAGAVIGGLGIGLLGVANLLSGDGVIRAFTRAGLLLFLIAPVLCVTAVFVDYWI